MEIKEVRERAEGCVDFGCTLLIGAFFGFICGFFVVANVFADIMQKREEGRIICPDPSKHAW